MLSPFRIFVTLAAVFITILLIGTAMVPAEKPAVFQTAELPFEKVQKEELEEDLPPEEPPETVVEETEEKKTIGETVKQVAKILAEPQPIPISSITLNERVRGALVNILCVPKTGGPFNSITGSGVFIDPRGVILTNAHVAQYFLLEDYPAPDFLSCIIRTGSPAYPTYTAELLYLSPSWIRENAQKIKDEAPVGNGEHDYALLYVIDTIDRQKEIPLEFPYVPLLYTEVQESADVLVAGYPAGFLGGIAIAKELYAASSPAMIGELYTYETSTVDIFSVGGSVVAQQGSSGGAVVDTVGNLVGLIVTSTVAADTSARDLHALASSYIARDFEKERGIPLPTFLSRDLEEEVVQFTLTTAPSLITALVSVLEKE